jgi:DNA-binding NtrC family response regulator
MVAPASNARRVNEQKKYSALIVDDDTNVLVSVESVLSDEVEVVAAASAERALELLKTRSFHVVISDFAMPGMDGSTLLTQIARLPEYVSCLLITGSDHYQPLAGGARHYVLFKPFDPERLLSMVRELGRVAEMKRSVKAMGEQISESRTKRG